jgi:hypothetical protein
VRRRDKQHLAFVASRPCLVCGRLPSEAHHLRFAQPRALGRKVSDEFSVPLCRYHHRQAHEHGEEQAWWLSQRIEPLTTARELWERSQSGMPTAVESTDSREQLRNLTSRSGR